MPVKLRAPKERHAQFSAEALALFVEIERSRKLDRDSTRELALLLGLAAEWWTGNHVNDRSAAPYHPPEYIAHRDWHRCRQVRAALLAASLVRPEPPSESDAALLV